jgi:hypothetical protein
MSKQRHPDADSEPFEVGAAGSSGSIDSMDCGGDDFAVTPEVTDEDHDEAPAHDEAAAEAGEVAEGPHTDFLGDVTQLYLERYRRQPAADRRRRARPGTQGSPKCNFAARQKMIVSQPAPRREYRQALSEPWHTARSTSIEEGNLGLIHALEKVRP